MAYQLALLIDGKVVSDQFESFTLDQHFDVIVHKVISRTGQSEIVHIPGAFSLTPLTLIRRMDAASSILQGYFQSIQKGQYEQVKTTIILICADSNGKELFRYTFSQAWIRGIIASGNRHGGTAPEEQIQIAFDAVSLTFA